VAELAEAIQKRLGAEGTDKLKDNSSIEVCERSSICPNFY